ncbi:uncharacterized protein moto [Melanotaenia boesemani]|uniref:uncharacterized protein moto n=1 Tax=Melanotaenia boesemani TaxID=1250792 RepID=UPI001C0502FA|nr:uncharacterized protein moto [Melanotaenia boesemani]
MAFDGHQSKFSNSLFQPCPRQTGVNVGGINNGSVPVPFVSIPSTSHQEQASYVPWSHNTQDKPYEAFGYNQASNKSRKPTDNADCDGEADLQGLVSNILDETESWDSYCSESLPTDNPIWSPKILREELLQYFHSEAKMLHNSSFPSNDLFHEIFSKAQEQSVDKEVDELNQQSSGLATKRWPFSYPNGDSHSFRSHKLPPGLPVPNTVKTDSCQIQQSRNVTMPAYNDKGTDQPMNNFLGLGDIFRPQNEINGSCLDAFYDNGNTQSGAHPICNEQYVPEYMNQLVNSFQSFMANEHDNPYKHTVGMRKEDVMAEQWKTSSNAMSSQSTPTMQIPKQLFGDFKAGQKGRMKKQTFNLDALQDPHHTEYLQQTKPFSAPLNLPNQYQNKMMMNRENMSVSMNQYSKHHMQQEQLQRKIKPHMQKEKKVMHMSGIFGERFPRMQQTKTCMTDRDRHPFSQTPYMSFQGRAQSQRFDGERNMVTVGNRQLLTSFMYPVNDLQRHSNFPINSTFGSRSSLSCGNGVADMGGVVSAHEAAALNSYSRDMWTQRRESTFPGMVSAVPPSLMMSQGTPVIQLPLYLDECYEQWKCLEKERKRTEIILTKTFPGKRTSSVTNTNLPKTPPNPTRVDHLIAKHMREQAKVAGMLERMESLCGIPLHINIQTALKSHHMAICIMQARCQESANTTKLQQQGFHFTEGKDTFLMVMALKDLTATTRRLCSALGCALQMTLPKPTKTQSHHVYEEATCTERCSSPFQGCSFQL